MHLRIRRPLPGLPGKGEPGFNSGIPITSPADTRLHLVLGPASVVPHIKSAWVDLEYRGPIDDLPGEKWAPGLQSLSRSMATWPERPANDVPRQSAPFSLSPHIPRRLVADAALQTVSDRFIQGVESRTLLLTVRYGDALLDQGHGNLRVKIKRRARTRQTSKGRYLVQCPRSFRQHYGASGYVRPPTESQRIG